jgi:hypothetical protein
MSLFKHEFTYSIAKLIFKKLLIETTKLKAD